MKKLALTMTVALALCASMTASAATLTYTEWMDAITTAADEMVAAQNNDGGFDWTYDADPTKGTAENTQGATGRGLVAAYKVTGNAAYLQAAEEAATWLKNRIDNNPSEFLYNKDVEFLFELAAAGGTDHTSWASANAVGYFNMRMTTTGTTNGAQGVWDHYKNSAWMYPSGEMGGTKFWMIGEWGHVGQLLGSTEIYSGYTGAHLADELAALLINEYNDVASTWDRANDSFETLGLVGILEGAGFSSLKGTLGEQSVIDDLAGQSLTGWQDSGYATYALGLYDNDLAWYTGAEQIGHWILDGYFDVAVGSNLESRGEALLGLASVRPVPEPATISLLGLGLAGLAARRIRRKK